jgi:peptidoglycan LD-endopeptidase CwlK
MNTISRSRLALVYPPLASLVMKMSEGLFFDIEVTQGLRTWIEQDALYAQGRNSPGQIVTHAAGGYSWHNFGLAVDIVPEDIAPGQPDWNLNNPAWSRMVSIAESLGLVSGAEWHGADLDTPHVQMTGKFPVSPSDEVRALYMLNQDITDVWKQAF